MTLRNAFSFLMAVAMLTQVSEATVETVSGQTSTVPFSKEGEGLEGRGFERGADLVDAGSLKLIYSVRLQIASGNSLWTSPVFPAAGSSPLVVRTVMESSCPQPPYMNIDVRHADSKAWEPTQFTNGNDYYSGGEIDSLRFQINQPWYAVETCTLNVYAEAGLINPNPPNPNPNPIETLAGAIPFEGGFQQMMALELTPSPFITGFRVSIPQFCSQTEILEAHTITEGVADKAVLQDKAKNIFSVNAGVGSRISKIQLALVGPVDLKCQIPVYIFKK